MRRAKIVCPLGPATASPERIRALVDAGMDVARLNMSHGSHADHERAYSLVRQASDQSGHAIGIFADLQGPKIRLDTFGNGRAYLETGARFTITTREVEGDDTVCGTTYDGLPGDVSAGDPILIDDGKIRLKVVEVDGDDVVTEVVTGGPVSDHKGINLPGVPVSVPALSEKDVEDLRFAPPGICADLPIIAVRPFAPCCESGSKRDRAGQLALRLRRRVPGGVARFGGNSPKAPGRNASTY